MEEQKVDQWVQWLVALKVVYLVAGTAKCLEFGKVAVKAVTTAHM